MHVQVLEMATVTEDQVVMGASQCWGAQTIQDCSFHVDCALYT